MAKLNQICINGDCSETPNAFAKVNVDGTVLSADSNDDTLNVEAGTNITLTPTIASDTVEISAPNVYNKTEVDNLISGIEGLKYVKDVDPNKGVVANHVTGNTASGSYAFAEGNFTTASGDYSHSEGNNTHATGSGSHAEGGSSTASAQDAHAEGNNTRASGQSAHSEGNNTDAFATCSHAEGYQTAAGASGSLVGRAAHAEGGSTTASSDYSHAEGYGTTVSGFASHGEGYNNSVTGINGAHGEGYDVTASGTASHAEGSTTTASGLHSHAEGYSTTAYSQQSHAEGLSTQAGVSGGATGQASHAEGANTVASADYSHTEGFMSSASGEASHAEGYWNSATAQGAHAEGKSTEATAIGAHSEGGNTFANGVRSHAEGQNTIANGENQHVQGKFNEPDNNNVYAHIVGNGTTNANRSNAYALKWTGASTQKAAVEIQDMYIPQTTPAPANGHYGVHNDVAFRIVDSSGNTVGYLTDFFTDSRGRGVQLSVERTVEGEVLNNDLTLGIDDNGEATVEVTDGDAWTGAIGAVKKSGDTMTGHLKLQSSNINENTTPSANQWGNSQYQLLSMNGTRTAYWELGQLTDGKIGFEIGALRVVNGSNTYNTLNMYVTPTGENVVSVSSPVAWRSALGLVWNTFVKVQEFTKTGVATAAGSTRDYTFSVTLSGYTPIGIVGTRITSGGTTTLVSTYLSGASVTVRVRNNGTSSQTPDDVRIQVLFIINA